MGIEMIRAYLTKVAEDCGKTTMGLSSEAGVSREKLRDWMTGKSVPTEEEMERYCAAAGQKSLYDTVPGLRQFLNGGKPETEKPAAPKSERPARKSAPKPVPVPVRAESAKEPVPGFMPEPTSLPEPVQNETAEGASADVIEEFTGMVRSGMDRKEICQKLGIGKTTYYKYAKAAGLLDAKPKPEAPQPDPAPKPVPEPRPEPVSEPVAKEKPARTEKPVRKKKPQMPEDIEAAFKGVIKKGEITKEALADKVQALIGTITAAAGALGEAAVKAGGGYLDEIGTERIPEKYRPLLEAAEKAEDRGIEIAVTILKQFAKKEQ